MNTYTPERFTIKQLAKQLHISASSAYELIKALKQAGMIDSAKDPTDRRFIWHSMKLQRPLFKQRRLVDE